MSVEAIFTTALSKKTPEERAAYLDEACGQDSALRQRVETLLRSHDGAGPFLGTPAIERAAGNLAGPATEVEPPEEDGNEVTLDFLAPSDKPESLGRLGHYEVLEVIGKGGMGIVLRAFDEKLRRVVAIKVMAAQLAISATARKRFSREAQAQAAVSHDHVVTIHAVEDAVLPSAPGGEAPGARGLPYLVMQYVAGMSLQQRLDKDGPLQLHEILRIGMQTASGLAAAHAQGLIHRDIKPANILLENHVERVKITDFGLARAASEASLTQSGVVAGTPQYMSPEQAEGKAIDKRTDLFSLGSVLYAMCTGRPPFRASSSMAVLKRVCEQTPTHIRETNPDIPDWLVAIIDKLHAKDRSKRFESAEMVAKLLRQHLARLEDPQRAQRAAPELTSQQRNVVVPRWRRAALVATLVLGAFVAIVAGLALWHWSPGSNAVTPNADLPAENPSMPPVLDPGALAKTVEKKAKPESLAPAKKETAKPKPSAAALLAQAEALGNDGHREDAIALLREAVRLYPTDSRIHRRLGFDLMSAWQNDEAIAALRKAFELNPNYWDTTAELARTLCRKGALDEALEWARQSVQQAGNHINAGYTYTSLGLVLADAGQLDEAIKECREGVRRKPNDKFSHFALGSVLARNGQLNDAIAAFQLGVKRDPKSVYLQNGLAGVLAKNGQTEEAIAILQTVVAAKPNYNDLLAAQIHLGKTFAKTGNIDKCTAAYRDVLLSKPVSDFHHIGFAWVLATSPNAGQRDPKAAVDNAKKATELNVVNGDGWSVLGVAQYRNGDWKAAVKAFQQSLKWRNGGDAVDWFFLAMTQWQLGDREAARVWHEKGVAWVDNNWDDLELRSFRAEAAQLLGITK